MSKDPAKRRKEFSKLKIKMSYTYRNFALGLMIIWSFPARELKEIKIAVLVKDPVHVNCNARSFNRNMPFGVSHPAHFTFLFN